MKVLSHWRSYTLLVYAEFFTIGIKRNAGYQRNALPDRHHFGVHPLVCGLSVELCHWEEIMQERVVFVDHSSINRLAIRFLPLLEKVFGKHKRPLGGSWWMDETYIKVKGV